MIQKLKIASGLALALIVTTPDAHAAGARTWKIDKGGSSLGFNVVVNGAGYEGNFKSFDGEIAFDPSALDNSHVKINVGMTSANSSYEGMGKALVGAEWFDAKTYPSATYQASSFTKTGENTYQANGTLTIRNKSLPVTLDFTLNEYSPTHATVTGTTSIRRNDFGVGQGEYTDTGTVGDDVKINFTIKASSK